jgi:3-oxoacyl-[acyl-carrier protein] reductase
MHANDSFSGRVALLTGASGGIGTAIARRLAGDGAAVALAYGTGAEAAETLGEELIAAGGRAVTFGADLRRVRAPRELVDAVQERLGPIDLLIANAGVARVQQLEEVTPADFDETMAVNLRAPFLLAQHTVGGMRERGFGRVLFVSSIAAFTGGIVGPHYAAAKAGLHGLTHYLASRLAGDGVTVNAVAPALITETSMLPGDPEELRSRVPVGRLGRPEEVADLVMAILGNGYLTNQVVSLDGGILPR